MPALAFGLNTGKAKPGSTGPPQKRKAIFDDDNEDGPGTTSSITGEGSDEDEGVFGRLKKPSKISKTTSSSNGAPKQNYANLSSMRSAKLHDKKAAEVDASVYDYDAAYDTFQAAKEAKTKTKDNSSGPKYMNALLQSADVRKRDQLRAKEKLLQREREAEGDEFADKEKFVTGAYKKQQEENRRLEEEEKKREEEEEERRRKGGGMSGFYHDMLKKDEERMKDIEEAAAKKVSEGEVQVDPVEEEENEAKMAQRLNERGGRIVVNDEGEVVDKRQLLSAGLNVSQKKSDSTNNQSGKQQQASRPQDYSQSSKARDAREAQRERQSRMMERQIEEMAEKQKQADTEEAKEREAKMKSKVTETDRMSARDRYLQRKKEKEEEARKAKEAKGSG